MSMDSGKVEINAACKMCRMCVRNCPVGAITVEEEKVEAIDKSLWRDILVYVEHDNESIHPVSYELIGKALELAKPVNMKVAALMAGKNIREKAQELIERVTSSKSFDEALQIMTEYVNPVSEFGMDEDEFDIDI